MLFAGVAFQGLLDVFKAHPDQSYAPKSFRLADVAASARAACTGTGFTHTDVAPQLGYKNETLMLSLRTDPVTECIRRAGLPTQGNNHADNHFQLQPVILRNPATGERIINEFWTADLWNRTQQTTPHNILWFLCWSDKVQFDGASRAIGHPLTFSCGAFEARGEMWGCSDSAT